MIYRYNKTWNPWYDLCINILPYYHKKFLRVNRTGNFKGKPTYFTYLAKVVDNTNCPEITSLTLGQYPFVLKKTLEGEYALDEYGDFLDQFTATTGICVWRIFLQKLKVVTNEYRNSIVHHTHMNIDQCEHLRCLVFKEKNSLLPACSKIIAITEKKNALMTK